MILSCHFYKQITFEYFAEEEKAVVILRSFDVFQRVTDRNSGAGRHRNSIVFSSEKPLLQDPNRAIKLGAVKMHHVTLLCAFIIACFLCSVTIDFLLCSVMIAVFICYVITVPLSTALFDMEYLIHFFFLFPHVSHSWNAFWSWRGPCAIWEAPLWRTTIYFCRQIDLCIFTWKSSGFSFGSTFEVY